VSTPTAVDVVINTHLHSTTSAGTPWGVTARGSLRFPMPLPDGRTRLRHFHPDSVAQRPAPRTDVEAAWQAGGLIVFEDSILPVEEQIELWSTTISSRVDTAATRTGPHAWRVQWYGSTQASRRVRGRPDALPDAASPTQPIHARGMKDFTAAAVTRKRVLTEARGASKR